MASVAAYGQTPDTPPPFHALCLATFVDAAITKGSCNYDDCDDCRLQAAGK